MVKTVQDILRKVREDDITFTRFLYIDNDGIIRGQASIDDQLEGDLKTGHGTSIAMPFFGAMDTPGPETRFGCMGVLSAVPDINTFRTLPFVPNSASLICDLRTKETHEDSGICARMALKRLLGKADFQICAAFENEFYLLSRDAKGQLQPIENSLCFVTSGMNYAVKVIQDVVKALQAQEITVEKYLAEYGPGQHEIAIKYSDALRACDNQVLFRETVRGVAQNHDLVASFMPKIFQNKAGSGAHIHFSLWSGGENILYDPNDEHQLSDIGRYFIGGILKHIGAICAFTAPTVTSYKRLIPHSWASAFRCYGLDNREAAVRIIPGSRGKEAKTFNLEFKPVDGTCNPYLAVTAVLAAGLEGIEKKISPGKAITCDPADLSPKERQQAGIKRLPENLGEAIDELEKDKFYADVFGEVMFDEYIKLKRFSWKEYNRQITQWELDKYAEAF